MQLLTRYFVRLAGWSVALFGFLLLAGSGGEIWSTMFRAPALASFAMILACFPAGLSVGASVLETPRTFLREGIKLTLVTFTLIAVAFVVIQYVAPTALAGGRLVTDAGNEIEPRELTLPELREWGREVVRRAEAGPRTDLDAWFEANTFAFEHERRLAHSSLPFFLTWIGALAGYWAARIRHVQLRTAQLLAMGLFILVSMYLGGENGYELVAVRAAGQAYFAAWFIVFVPAMLGLGLGWPTMVSIFAQGSPPPTVGNAGPT
jgi:hypothetical protein